jgi:glycosyltransferase involved in cell wall biosynthesis
VLATDTEGQQWVHEHVPGDGVALCPVEDVGAMAEQLRRWTRSPETRRRAAETAQRAAEERFNWEVEKDAVLSTVRSVLDR